MNERIHAIIMGRVQMVMFRDFAQRKASGLGITGEVRNLPDGTVEVIAEGTHSDLEEFIEKLRHGPVLAHVEHLSIAWQPAQGGFRKFRIAYD